MITSARSFHESLLTGDQQAACACNLARILSGLASRRDNVWLPPIWAGFARIELVASPRICDLHAANNLSGNALPLSSPGEIGSMFETGLMQVVTSRK